MGGALDDVAAENRAAIARQIGRPVPTGAATIGDVVAMSRAGVEDRLIVSHIRNSGSAAPLTAADVIYLHDQNVSTPVIEAMQRPVPRAVPVPVGVPPPVLIAPYPYGPPPLHPHYGFHFD